MQAASPEEQVPGFPSPLLLEIMREDKFVITYGKAGKPFGTIRPFGTLNLVAEKLTLKADCKLHSRCSRIYTGGPQARAARLCTAREHARTARVLGRCEGSNNVCVALCGVPRIARCRTHRVRWSSGWRMGSAWAAVMTTKHARCLVALWAPLLSNLHLPIAECSNCEHAACSMQCSVRQRTPSCGVCRLSWATWRRKGAKWQARVLRRSASARPQVAQSI
jgi:hypothetical protein